MVLKKLSQRIRKVRASFEKTKAKVHGMTVPELRRHLAKRKAEKRAFKAELRRIEEKEKEKFEKWKIERKYKRKRKLAKAGKGGFKGALTEFTGAMEMLGGKPSEGGPDPFGIFGTPGKPRRKRKTAPKKRKRKRKKR